MVEIGHEMITNHQEPCQGDNASEIAKVKHCKVLGEVMPRRRVSNNSISELGFQRNYSSYRKVLLDLANYLQDNNKLHEALLSFLQVSCLDVNENKESDDDPESKILSLFPTSSQSIGTQENVIVNKIYQLSYDLEINNSDLKEHYFAVASELRKNMKASVNPEFGWKVLEKELRDYSNKKSWTRK